MSTAVDNNDIDPVPAKIGEVEEHKSNEVMPFKWYLSADPCYEILQKRWGLFTLLGFIVYAFHFVMTIFGVDMYCHFSRFRGPCDGIDDKEEYDQLTAVMDMHIGVVAIFHMIEWIRQWVFLTTVLVGVNWMNCFYLLSLNVPFGFIACFLAVIKGYSVTECGVDAVAAVFGDDGKVIKEGVDETGQLTRVRYLRFQILSFFLYIPFCFMHILIFAWNNKCNKPRETILDDDKNDTGELMYTSWVQKQHDMEEEEDDD